MKNIRMTFALFIGLVLFSESQAQTVRNFSLPGEENQNVQFKDIQGDVLTVIDFWTSWCKPCLKAIPELIHLHEKYDSLGVAFIGINADGPRSVSKALPLAKSLGVNYPILFDTSGELISELNVTAFPTLLIIDRQRKVVFTHEGFSKNDGALIDEAIREALTINRE
ncbi:MAG: TlpA family protein disulfide reductase [Prolixibacteraceae bacterium]|nr:TlpA family protein disulfide reductase [Prolixibacteraceae bacterium]